MNNICFFNSIPFWGGGEKLHLENAVEFKKKNYPVIIASNPTSPLWRKALIEKIQTYPIEVKNISFLNPVKLLKTIRFYKNFNIDTVVFSTSQDLKLGGISAKLAGVKNIVYLRGLAVPIKASFINKFIFKSILTHIIPNSDETKRSILKHLGPYIKKSKIKTIYHGIDIDKIKHHTNKLDIIQEKGHGIILGNAGRLTIQKGQHNLIEVARNLKEKNIDFSLFIAGTGELESKLRSLIDAYNLQNNVFLLGFVKDMDQFMSSIDIFLLTSTWEGFGFVLVEAMIHSKPVVAFDTTSNPEIVKANTCGFLVDYPDLDMFTEKTLLLINDENLRKKMGNAGVKIVQEHFVLKDRVSEIEDYIINSHKP